MADGLSILSDILGWIYFFAWSISFYPQVWINYKRKSVVGLSFDFLAYNFFGFLCYMTYNVALYSSNTVHKEYWKSFPHSNIPVDFNDVAFAVHAWLLTTITCLQCFVYERGSNTVSREARLVLVLLSGIVVSSLAYTFMYRDFLWFLDVLGFIKMFISLIKYTPQAWMNYRRQSTVGWSIENILCDITGGSLSILQEFVDAAHDHSWSRITGNVIKFGLGFISISYDILFILQHYVFYKEARKKEKTREKHVYPEDDGL